MRKVWGALLLSSLYLPTALATPHHPIYQQPVLALTPVQGPEDIDQLCTAALYQQILRANAYQLLPEWYVGEQLRQTVLPLQTNWEDIFKTLPEADLVLFSHLQSVQGLELVSVLVSRNESGLPQILKARIQPVSRYHLVAGCENMAHQLLGLETEDRFRSPALSASLSMLIPGAGHFYQGTLEGVALGIIFLGASMAFAWLGFSQNEQMGLSSSQWGGLLLLLSLSDMLSAYFMADTSGQGNPKP